MNRFALLLALITPSCVSPVNELERVAKDWCTTIRASQILPVYPLSEDVRPGDVFMVAAPLAEQARIFEEKGFLPLDQLVTRLPDLPYQSFYANANWEGQFGSAAADAAATKSSNLPKVAFPTYNFEVNRSSGLQLAIPIQGVPIGLGLMNADRVEGAVTIRDAYTYGVDAQSLIAALYTWWSQNKDVSRTLREVARQTHQPVFLRVVTRVFLTEGVSVTMSNTSSAGAGIDAGAAPELQLLSLAASDPLAVDSAIAAYAKASEAVQKKFNDLSKGAGGSYRLAQASRRSISLEEDFAAPLVIGYRGFDVKVYEDGTLSAPIPSFSSISEGDDHAPPLGSGLDPVQFFAEQPVDPPASSPATIDPARLAELQAWINRGKNRDTFQRWLSRMGMPRNSTIASLQAPLQAKAIAEFLAP